MEKCNNCGYEPIFEESDNVMDWMKIIFCIIAGIIIIKFGILS